MARHPSRIIVADDHPLFRFAVRQVVAGQPELEVVGEAADGQEAVALCRCLRPELVLMDVRMPRMDGLEATRVIKREFPATIVLVLTAFGEPDYLAEALRAGAAGYVLKHESGPHIISAIQRVLAGEVLLDQEVTTQLLTRLYSDSVCMKPFEERYETTFLESLSPREMDVLRLVVRGWTNQHIARSLLVSVSTVKKHVHSIILKLGVSDRTQAAVRALEVGLLSGREVE